MRSLHVVRILGPVFAVAIAVATVSPRVARAIVASYTPGDVIRLAGNDRVDTAIAISANSFPNGGTAGAVVLARDDTYPDGVSAAPLALAFTAPVLLTSPAALDARTESELRRVVPSGRTVFLIGGIDALSAAVADKVAADGYGVYRVAGADRFATAVDIATVLNNPSTILLATGDNFPDALVGGAAAAHVAGAVLLTDDTRMPAATANYLAAHPPTRVYAIGDQAAAADSAATAVRGNDRYDTSVAVANQFWPNSGGTSASRAGVTTGLNFPDALAAGPHITRSPSGPLLLTTPDQLPTAVDTYLKDLGCYASAPSVVYGQTDAVSQHVEDQLREDVSGDFCP